MCVFTATTNFRWTQNHLSLLFPSNSSECGTESYFNISQGAIIRFFLFSVQLVNSIRNRVDKYPSERLRRVTKRSDIIITDHKLPCPQCIINWNIFNLNSHRYSYGVQHPNSSSSRLQSPLLLLVDEMETNIGTTIYCTGERIRRRSF